MSRIARAAVLALPLAAAFGSSGCAYPRAHPWQPPPFRPPIHTWTATYGEFPSYMYDRPHVPVQGKPGDG